MYANFSRLLGLISVKETGSHIIVNGIPGLRFSKDVYNHWKTSKLNNNMFTAISRSGVKFPKFYAIEVLYMLDQLIQSRRTYVGRRTLQRVRDELIAGTWLRNIGLGDFTSRLNMSALKDLTVTLFPHQINFLQHYDRATFEYSLNGMLMDAAAGSGKTISQYATAHCLGADTSVLVVPKNSVFDVWVKTIKVLFKQTPEYWHSLSGEELTLGKKYYIVHYDYLEKFLAFVEANKGSFGKVYVGIDESHNFNEQSNRTNLLIKLCQTLKARDVIHASGTPFKAMGSEAITLLATICNDFTPEVQGSFRKIFGKEAKRAIEILANRIGIVSFKVVKADIETPGVDYHEIKVPMNNSSEYTLTSVREKMSKFIDERLAFYRKGMPEYEKLYATCMDLHGQTVKGGMASAAFAEYRRGVAQLRKGYDPVTMKDLVMYCNRYELKTIVPSLPERYRKPFLNVRAIIKYVDLKVMGEALSQVLGRLRIQCHLDMLPNMPLDEIIDNATTKTVIFTSYVEVVKELEGLLTKAGYKPLLVYGETNKDLPNIVKRFENDDDINPLVATFKSLSTAVPLTMANTVVFTNAPFRDYERTQTIARVDRIGQKHRCHVWETYLDTGAEPNISTRSKDIMAWSKSQVEAILGVSAPDDLETSLESLVENPNATLATAESFMEQLKQQLPIDVVEDEEVSMEGFGTMLSGLFKGRKPTSLPEEQKWNRQHQEAIAKFLRELEKTYLSTTWLSKQKYVTGSIPASDIAKHFTVKGRIEENPLAGIVLARQSVDRFCKAWRQVLKSTDDKVQAINARVKGETAQLMYDDEQAALELVRDAIKEMEAIPDPVKKFPLIQGTGLRNMIPYVDDHGDVNVKSSPKADEITTMAALTKEQVFEAAKLVKTLLNDGKWDPSSTLFMGLRWLDHSEGSRFSNWIYDADNSLYDDYYDRFYHQTCSQAWTDGLYGMLDQYKLAVALVKLIERSIK